MAISPEAPRFTATWMLGKMVRDIKKRFPEIAKLISYQDVEVHKGTIYVAGGWIKHSTETKFMSWNTEKRKRNKPQSKANKVRWELAISRPCKNLTRVYQVERRFDENN
ncbi:MAG: hypothetical protein DDT23_01293 [candidate division WS2 bacterium]|nr:hypothetical protein [Candidatus Lithacetigena glycinireducens]